MNNEYSYNPSSMESAIECAKSAQVLMGEISDKANSMKGDTLPSSYDSSTFSGALSAIGKTGDSVDQIPTILLQIKQANDDASSTGESELATAGMFGLKLIAGFFKGAENIIDGVGSLAAGALAAVGAKSASDAVSNFVAKDWVEDSVSGAYDFLEAHGSISRDSTACNIIEGVGVGCFYAATAAVTGGGSLAANVASAAVGGFGAGTAEGLRSGDTLTEAYADGAKQAAWEAGSEFGFALAGKAVKAGVAAAKGAGKEVVQEAVEAGAKQGAKESGQELIEAGAKNGQKLLTEGTDAAADAAKAGTKAADAAADAAKTGTKAADAAADAAKTGTKAADAAADAAKTGTKAADAAADAAKTGTKAADAAADAAKTGTKVADTAADAAKTGTKVADTAADAAKTGTKVADTAADAAKTGTKVADTAADAAKTGTKVADSVDEVLDGTYSLKGSDVVDSRVEIPDHDFKLDGDSKWRYPGAGASNADEVVEAVGKNSDEVVEAVGKNSDEIVEAVGKNSDEVVEAVGKNSDEIVEAVGKNSDEVVEAVGKNSDEVVEAVGKNSDEVVEAVGKNSDEVVEAVGKNSDEVVEAVGKNSDEVVEAVGKNSDEVVDAYTPVSSSEALVPVDSNSTSLAPIDHAGYDPTTGTRFWDTGEVVEDVLDPTEVINPDGSIIRLDDAGKAAGNAAADAGKATGVIPAKPTVTTPISNIIRNTFTPAGVTNIATSALISGFVNPTTQTTPTDTTSTIPVTPTDTTIDTPVETPTDDTPADNPVTPTDDTPSGGGGGGSGGGGSSSSDDEEEKAYTLTIKYVYKYDPSVVARTETKSITAGSAYNITPTAVTYYTADPSIITGTMPNSDLDVMVTYVPIHDENNNGKADEEENLGNTDTTTTTEEHHYHYGSSSSSEETVTEEEQVVEEEPTEIIDEEEKEVIPEIHPQADPGLASVTKENGSNILPIIGGVAAVGAAAAIGKTAYDKYKEEKEDNELVDTEYSDDYNYDTNYNDYAVPATDTVAVSDERDNLNSMEKIEDFVSQDDYYNTLDEGLKEE